MKTIVKNILNQAGYQVSKYYKYLVPIDTYKELYGATNREQNLFLNIGAGGEFRHPLWTNVDVKSDWYKNNQIDIHYNLTECSPLPLPDNSAKIIYTSHTIEHVQNKHVANLFNEAYRVLAPGGLLRVTAPNIDLDYRAYVNNDTRHYYWCYMEKAWQQSDREYFRGASIAQLFLHHFATEISTLHPVDSGNKITDEDLKQIFANKPYEEALDYCISKCSLETQNKFMGNHINWWNPDKARKFLANAGFNKIEDSGFGQSESPVLRDINYFDNTHPRISFYIEATK